MRILHIESGMTFNGGPRQVWELINGLAVQGVDNIVLCPDNSETAQYINQHNKHTNNQVQTIAMQGDLDIGMFGRIYQVINTVKPSIVHVHSRRGADLWGVLAARKANVPVVVSRRVDNTEFAPFARWKYHRYSHVITISEAIKRVLLQQGVSAARITCIHDAVDSTLIPTYANKSALLSTFNLPDNAIVMVMVAQLIKRKGHRYTLQAMARLTQYPNLHLFCFGKGGQLASLQAMAQALGMSDRVHFVGFRDDLLHWLPAFDLLVHPADTEGMGVALLQASAAGLPIVASKAGGIPEVVIDGQTGLLIDIGDVNALAHSIDTLLSDSTLSTQLGAAAQQRIQHDFSCQQMVAQHVALYHTLMV